MSSRNISSSPAPSAWRSSVSATPPARATSPTRSGVGLGAQRPVARPASATIPAPASTRPSRSRSVARTRVPGGVQQLGLGALGDDPAVADHHDVVGDDLDLVQQVRGEQDGPAPVREVAQQVAHPADPAGVEPVGGLVEDQHAGVPDQGGPDAEPLPHAERVVADPTLGLGAGQPDEVQHLLDPAGREAHGALGDGQDLAAGAAGVLRGGVEQDADLDAGVGQVGEPLPVDGGGAGGRRGQGDHDPERGGLAGAVGTEEAGDATGPGREGDVVDGGGGAVLLGEVLDLDHDEKPGPATGPGTSGKPLNRPPEGPLVRSQGCGRLHDGRSRSPATRSRARRIVRGDRPGRVRRARGGEVPDGPEGGQHE